MLFILEGCRQLMPALYNLSVSELSALNWECMCAVEVVHESLFGSILS